MKHGIVTEQQLVALEQTLQQELIANGVACAMLLDVAGNTIACRQQQEGLFDTYALAALGAGNFAAVESMAALVGEKKFSQLFHQGAAMNIHCSKIAQDLLLLCVFTVKLPLGLVRLKIDLLAEAVNRIAGDGDSG